MHKLVLLRHGESQWNLENRFTGWHDVNLTEQGEREGREAGRLLKAEGFEFDVAYTSVLTRAIRTLWLALTEMDQVWIPVHREWRLNERHYGALQGLNKAETAEKHGDEQVLVWRRSYDIPPPPMSKDDDGYAGKDRRYANLDEAHIPLTECLKDTVARFLPLWEETIAPQIKAGKNVLIAAHGNSLRALIKYLLYIYSVLEYRSPLKSSFCPVNILNPLTLLSNRNKWMICLADCFYSSYFCL